MIICWWQCCDGCPVLSIVGLPPSGISECKVTKSYRQWNVEIEKIGLAGTFLSCPHVGFHFFISPHRSALVFASAGYAVCECALAASRVRGRRPVSAHSQARKCALIFYPPFTMPGVMPNMSLNASVNERWSLYPTRYMASATLTVWFCSRW